MADGDDNNLVGFLIEDDAIISHPEPCTILSCQLFHVALAGSRKNLKLGKNPPSQLQGQLHPLPSRGRLKDDRAHEHKYRFMRYLCQGLVAMMIAFSSPVHAVQPDEVLPNPALELRARDLSRELRCMVCQNQSIDDSDAPLARDLRLLVRERITAGDSDNQVMDFLVARYGEFVLLKPRFEGHTWLLWLLTPVLLIGGGVALWRHHRQRGAEVAIDDPALRLTPDEEARIARLIEGEPAADKST